MRCGKGHEHDTVAEVRECYGVNEVINQRPNKFTAKCASCGDLVLANMGHIEPRDGGGWNVLHNEACEPKPVQAKIDYKPQGKDDYPDIPEGFYATPSLTGNNDFDFWRVEKPTEGKWAGLTFVKRVIGGRDDANIPRDSKKHVKTERMAKVTQFAALDAIRAFGPEKSHELFGTELKYCRSCGIHLTDETSRSLGIGPICRSA